MMFRVRPFRCAAPLLAGLLALSGCERYAQSQFDEEKEPHFLAGKSRVSTMDYRGAIESFEKAIQVNPRSASAHFELACLFDQKEADPAAAIYHYEHYLKLRPTTENAEVVKQRITACKQMLAQTVSLGPVTEKVQREFELLSEEKKRLTEENQKLREELEKCRSSATVLQRATNRPVAVPGVNRAVPASFPVPASSAPPSGSSVTFARLAPAGARTHTVRAGETPTLIARQYGIRVEALMAANPRLNPRRMQVGQAVSIPLQ
jgi:LysM repeat protein